MSTDNFEFDLTSDFDGYESSTDKTKVGPRMLVRGSKNVYRKTSGTIASRPGQKRRGTADSTNAGVKSAYEWITSKGVSIPLRVANGKLQFESLIADGSTYVWYDLMTSLTLTRFVFYPWWDNTDKKDELIFVKHDTNMHSWAGGVTLVVSGTNNTITKLDSSTTWAQDGFASTGTVTINGVDYTYSGGTNTATLTGVGTDASGLTSGLVGFSKVVTNSNTPASTFTNDFIIVIGNRLHVGSYTSNLIYISKQTDFSDFSFSATRAPGDAELLTLDTPSKGISVRDGNAHIFAGTGDLYIVSYQSITVSTTLTQQTTVDKKQLGNLASALAHEFIDVKDNNIVYLDQNNQLRTYGTFRNLFQDVAPLLSQQVLDELGEEDFTGGHLKIVAGNLGTAMYLTAPISGRTFFYQELQELDTVGNVVAKRLWQPPQIWGISRIAIIAGVVYGHSNSNPQIYQLWDTDQWHDDSPSDEPIPYVCVQRMSYKRVNGKYGPRRQGLGIFDKAFFEGYMANGVNLYANIYLGYQGSQGLRNVVINSIQFPAQFFSGVTPPPLGGNSLGDNPLGDGLSPEANDQDLLNKYIAITDVNPGNCFEYELEVYSYDLDSRWETLSLGVNISQAEQLPTFIRK